ncbi:MAG: hypothetical protein FWG98_09780 [Candidatus Cloacimonetes bacterium]|nr:hypothetical protein [Candidatus Cloacimonadota bacterium]
MLYKKISIIILLTSLLMLTVCLTIHFNTYFNISAPIYKNLVSARLLGVNNRDFFMELVWESQNKTFTSYSIDASELHFYERGIEIARVYLDDTIIINPFTSSIFIASATLNRDTFENLIYNYIEAFTFNLQGSIRAKTLFFGRELILEKNIPINIKELFNGFLQESFRNAVSMENISMAREADINILNCEINLYNRTGFDLFISSFEGNININRISNGTVISFEPISFSNNETTRNSNMSFRLDDNIQEDSSYFRYILEGIMTAVYWDTEFFFPIEIVGEI